MPRTETSRSPERAPSGEGCAEPVPRHARPPRRSPRRRGECSQAAISSSRSPGRRAGVRTGRGARSGDPLAPRDGGPPRPGTAVCRGGESGRPLPRTLSPSTPRPPTSGTKILHGARAVIVPKDERASTRILRCRSGSCGLPVVCPRGKSRNAARGGLTARVMSARSSCRASGSRRPPRALRPVHGLVADGSDRNEQHRVDAVLEEPVGQTGARSSEARREE